MCIISTVFLAILVLVQAGFTEVLSSPLPRVANNGMEEPFSSLDAAKNAALTRTYEVGYVIWQRTSGEFYISKKGDWLDWGRGVPNHTVHRVWLRDQASPTCTDNLQNQGEIGVDCGGPCAACPTCTDSLQNQGETGVDCGGPCAACPTCTDGLQNQGETDVDCGGPCAACVYTCSGLSVNSGVQFSKTNGDNHLSTATFSCSDGYVLSGDSSIQCSAATADGTWTFQQAPTCTENCPAGQYESSGMCSACIKKANCATTDVTKPCVSDTDDGVKDTLWCKAAISDDDFITDDGKVKNLVTTVRELLREIDELKSTCKGCAKAEDIADQCLE